MRHADRWDLPKGHVDAGETEMECAFRELDEETGITRDDVRLDPQFRFVHHYQVQSKRYDNQTRLKELVIFLAELIRPVPINVTEHLDFQWFDWNPPHSIQANTINPLLQQLESHWQPK